MNFSWVLLMEVKHNVHLLNHKRLKRTTLMCRLLWSFNFNIFFHLVNVSSCRLSSHYPFMINKPHSKLLEMPFGNLIGGFSKVHNLNRDINLEIVNESWHEHNIRKFIIQQMMTLQHNLQSTIPNSSWYMISTHKLFINHHPLLVHDCST